MGFIVGREKLEASGWIGACSNESDAHFEFTAKDGKTNASPRHQLLRRAYIGGCFTRKNSDATIYTEKGTDSRVGVISDDVRDTQRVI